MFDLSRLLSSVAADAMGLRGKRQRRAQGFLGGKRHSFLSTSSLLGLAGLGVAAYQIFKDKSAASSGARTVEPGTTVLGGSGSAFGGFAPAPAGSGAPPLPSAAAGAPAPAPAPAPGDLDLPMRAVRLMIAAARCDGNLGEEELGKLVSHAKDVGLEVEMRREWQSPRPLAEICAGIVDPAQQRDLYVLAFAVLRADDELTGAERVFLAGLAARLALSPDEAAALERDTARRIDQFA